MNSGVLVNIHLLKSIKNIVMANSWYEIQAPLFIFIIVCFFLIPYKDINFKEDYDTKRKSK